MAEPVERRIGEENDPGVCYDQERKQYQKQSDYMFRHQECINLDGMEFR
jgi:hypothetical protein